MIHTFRNNLSRNLYTSFVTQFCFMLPRGTDFGSPLEDKLSLNGM